MFRMKTPITYLLQRRLFCSFALAAVVPVHAQVAGLGDAINKAGRQRMLSQRMAKAWFGMGQGIQDERLGHLLSEAPAHDAARTQVEH